MSNTYSFYTELLGPRVKVEGVLHPEEPKTLNYPGHPKSFEIKTIRIVAIGCKDFEVECLSSSTLYAIEDAAFAAKTDELNQEPF
ncbi:MAG: hypothetical protein COB12_12465 [Flavobacterium sp.]|nr:MAG: hypothetical protein COB12_12465 [Flavobacterium sp.]